MSYSVKTPLRATASVVLVLALCFSVVVGLVGCGDGKSSPTTDKTVTTEAGTTATTATTLGSSVSAAALVGKWYCERIKETFEFTSDGKIIWTEDGKAPQTFTFKVEADAIVFRQPNAPDDNTLPFTLSGSTLTIMDPTYGRLTYTKQ